jgi:hypothetical protein
MVNCLFIIPDGGRCFYRITNIQNLSLRKSLKSFDLRLFSFWVAETGLEAMTIAVNASPTQCQSKRKKASVFLRRLFIWVAGTGLEAMTIAVNASPTQRQSKRKKASDFHLRLFHLGSGNRTRTYDLRVMSPTSYQLLHPALSFC